MGNEQCWLHWFIVICWQLRRMINLSVARSLSSLGCCASHRSCGSVSRTRQGSVRQLSSEIWGSQGHRKYLSPHPTTSGIPESFPCPSMHLINFIKLIGFISSPVSTRIQGCAWVTPLPCTGRSFKVTPLMQQGKHNLPVRNNTEGNKCSCCFGETRRFSFPITFRNNKCHGRTEVSWSCVDLKLLWGANRN